MILILSIKTIKNALVDNAHQKKYFDNAVIEPKD